MEVKTPSAIPAVHIDQIGQIALTVSDLSRAKHFYQHVLGMQFLFEAGTMAFFQIGSVRLMLGTPENASRHQPGEVDGTILYYKVGDLQQAHASLVEQGVHFLQPPHLVAKMPGHNLWMAFLKDPEGNALGLMSEVPHP